MAFAMPLPQSAFRASGYYRGLPVAGRWAKFRPIDGCPGRPAFGDLRGFVEAVSENEPVASDHFLGFAERAVYYGQEEPKIDFLCVCVKEGKNSF
jgi:hypothetical protein